MKFFLSVFIFISRLYHYILRKALLAKAVRQGMTVGENTLFVGSHDFGTEPFLISIGKNCLITNGVKFITHDGSIQVPLIEDGALFKEVYSKKSTFNKIEIADNVFVGVGVILLPGTKISSNSIVGAGSVVRGEFTCGSVIAGNPAKFICTTEDYYHRNSKNILNFTEGENRIDKIIKWLDND